MALPVIQGVGAGSETSMVPPAHQTNDLFIAVAEHGGGTIATPAGYTIVPGFPFSNSTISTISAFYRKATSGSEGAAALSGGTDHMWGRIFTIRGQHLTNPFARISTAVQQGGAITNASFPSVLTSENDNLIVNLMAWNIDNAGPLASAETNALLGSVTELFDDGTLTGNGGGLIGVSGTLASPGPSGQTTLTLATASQWLAATLAIRPALVTPYTVSGIATINGVVAANGVTVEIWDEILQAIETTCVTTGGAGGFSAAVAFNTPLRYRAMYDDGTHRGCSALGTAA